MFATAANLTFVLLMLASAGAQAQVQFTQIHDSGNLSQLIRSNTGHYWSYMEQEANLHQVKRYLDCEGVLLGDPHMGQFEPKPVDLRGREQMDFVAVDFDDSGRGPFVLDFVRYEVAVKADFSYVKKREIENAYIRGLQNYKMQPPTQIQDLLNMPVSQYEAMADKYTAKNTTSAGFILKRGQIEAFSSDAGVSRASVEALFPDEKVIDVAIRPRARGGSADAARIWSLVEGADGHRRIMELKQWEPSNLALYQKQPAIEEWLKEVQDAFWNGIDGSAYTLVEVEPQHWFWLRQKEVSLINVPYSSTKRAKMDYAYGLALYDAYQLGLHHGRQTLGVSYLTKILLDPEYFHNVTSDLVDTYLDVAKAAYKSKP